METLRNNNNYPGMFPGLKVLSKEYTTDGTQRVLTVETGCISVSYAAGFTKVTADESSPALALGVVSASTTYPGTKKVAFTIPASSTLHFIILGSVDLENTKAIAEATTEVLFEG